MVDQYSISSCTAKLVGIRVRSHREIAPKFKFGHQCETARESEGNWHCKINYQHKRESCNVSTIEIRSVSRYHFFDEDNKILVEWEFLLECHIKLAMRLILKFKRNFISLFIRIFIERNARTRSRYNPNIQIIYGREYIPYNNLIISFSLFLLLVFIYLFPFRQLESLDSLFLHRFAFHSRH